MGRGGWVGGATRHASLGRPDDVSNRNLSSFSLALWEGANLANRVPHLTGSKGVQVLTALCRLGVWGVAFVESGDSEGWCASVYLNYLNLHIYSDKSFPWDWFLNVRFLVHSSCWINLHLAAMFLLQTSKSLLNTFWTWCETRTDVETFPSVFNMDTTTSG